jgi:hypothetical protein
VAQRAPRIVKAKKYFFMEDPSIGKRKRVVNREGFLAVSNFANSVRPARCHVAAEIKQAGTVSRPGLLFGQPVVLVGSSRCDDRTPRRGVPTQLALAPRCWFVSFGLVSLHVCAGGRFRPASENPAIEKATKNGRSEAA